MKRMFNDGVGRHALEMLTVCTLLAGSACSGAEADDVDGTDTQVLGATGQALHGGGGQLPFRGSRPLFPGEASQPAGSLTLVYAVQIGLTSDHVRSLDVCWYKPSNPDNFFRDGDPTECTTIGQDTATVYHAQICPAGFVASGYELKIAGSGDRIDSMGMTCRSLTDVDDTFGFAMEGSSDRLFSEFLNCQPNLTPAKGYIESINMNANGDGVGAQCVLP